MQGVDLILFALLVAALGCSIIELGISAYFVDITSVRARVNYNPDTDLGYTVSYGRGPAPSSISFLLFVSIYSTLVTAVLLAIPVILRRGISINDKTLSIGTLALKVLTTIFWLAGFANLSALYGGYSVGGILGAALAFAVIPWLIYLAMTVLHLLTAFGVLRSQRPGHQVMFGRHSQNTNMHNTQMTSVDVDRTVATPKV